MATESNNTQISHLNVTKELTIAASADIVFQTILQPHGPLKEMNLKLEAWPGGRWYRDTGNSTGHLWGHVQVIKPPKVLELIGPTMMSFPAVSHIQYRLSEQAGETVLEFTHRAFGYIPANLEADVTRGWSEMLTVVKQAAESK